VLTSQSLATFTLVDCAQSLLGETLEVLGAHHLAALAQCVKEASSSSRAAGGSSAAGSSAAAQQTPVKGRRSAGSGRHPQQPATPAAGGTGEAAAAAAIAPSWQAAAARLARYAQRRVQLVGHLLARLATLPEAFEMARVTGLTINQVGGRSGQGLRQWQWTAGRRA
jgi:DNA polymerase delta subunit 1